MATGRTQTPPTRSPSLAPMVATLAPVLAVGALWFGLPGLTLAWLTVLVASWLAAPVAFTGKKDATGRPTPAHPGERAAMDRYLFWRDLRWRLFTPNADWLPGWPVSALRAAYFSAVAAKVVTGWRKIRDRTENLVRRDGETSQSEAATATKAAPSGFFSKTLAVWLMSLWLVAAAFTLPYRLPGLELVDAAFGYLLLMQWTGSKRRTLVAGDPCPGVRLDTLRGSLTWATILGAALAAGVGACAGWYASPAWVGLGAVAGAGLAVSFNWRTAALADWRDVVAARSEWAPRWQMLKHDPAPFLTGRARIGQALVDTFTAPAATGATTFWKMAPQISPTIGAGTRIAVLSVPNTDGNGQPLPGTRHPLAFQVVQWPADYAPDVTSFDADPAEVELFLQCAFVWMCDASGYARPIVQQVVGLGVPATSNPTEAVEEPELEVFDAEPSWVDDGGLYVPDSPTTDSSAFEADLAVLTPLSDPIAEPGIAGGTTQVWAASLLLPEGPPMSHVRSAMAGPVAETLRCEVLVDHRTGSFYFGAATAETTVIDPNTGVTAKQLADLATEDRWNTRWAEVMKQDANPPTIEHSTYAEETLPGGRTVHRQAFVTRQGVDPMKFFGLEADLAATLSAAPFVAVAGWSTRGRVGERHPQAFTVYWSADTVPANPDTLAPTRSDAARWVLTGRMNEAFKASRLARPEVYEARCLTHARSRGHIWAMKVRLYGGVTLADVRGAAQRLRQHLGSEWLRVEAAQDGCVIVAGTTPSKARLADPARDSDYLAALDWEQAWLDSKISGVGGFTPKLLGTSTLPHNEKVQVLDFELPAGLALSDIKAATAKLGNATTNAFVEVRTTEKANVVRLLVCEVNPLPEYAPFDFAAVDASDAIPFATGVEGEPVIFDPADSPHALLAGVTGAGKTTLAQDFLYGFAVRGAEIYIIDPVKGGADFAFVKPYAKAFATTPFEAAAVMKHIYAEVVRRKDANAAAGVGSYKDLPNPPKPIVVMTDEFTSLMGQAMVPKPSDDPTMDAERELILAENQARTEVGVYTGKLAREARSAGVTELLGTQKLSAKMLDSIPGASDVKTNLARTILGAASSGDRMSALRNFDDIPKLGDSIPKGRGLWEPLTSSAIAIQVWYATQEQFAAELAARIEPLPAEQVLDLSGAGPRSEAPSIQSVPPAGAPVAGTEPVEVVELDALEMSLDELDLSDEDWDLDLATGPASGVTPDAPEPVTVALHCPPDEPALGPAPSVGVNTLATDQSAHPIASLQWDGWRVDLTEWDDIADDGPELDWDDDLGDWAATGWAEDHLPRVWASSPMADPFGATAPPPEPTSATAVTRHATAAVPAAGGPGYVPFTDEDLTGPLVASHTKWGVLRIADTDLVDYLPARDSAYGWPLLDAIDTYLAAHPGVSTVVWDDPRLDEDDEMGVPFREIASDLIAAHGATLTTPTADRGSNPF